MRRTTRRARLFALTIVVAGCATATVAPREPDGDAIAWQSVIDEWHDWMVTQDSIYVSLGMTPFWRDPANEAHVMAWRFRGGVCDSTYTRRIVDGTRRPC